MSEPVVHLCNKAPIFKYVWKGRKILYCCGACIRKLGKMSVAHSNEVSFVALTLKEYHERQNICNGKYVSNM